MAHWCLLTFHPMGNVNTFLGIESVGPTLKFPIPLKLVPELNYAVFVSTSTTLVRGISLTHLHSPTLVQFH